ncbi:unnamed protein product [Linum trigynum]|uniref:Uncharacterized protein n=1 Tax=Linum trigynum TaxID=586398 RepID=A0AAV2CL86_9ROSI
MVNLHFPPQQPLTPKLSDLRSYDDDEVAIPTAGGRFISILEAADENAEDEDDSEEFQGFFFNPTHSSSMKAPPPLHASSTAVATILNRSHR